jgi:hypothetical protein
VDLGNTLPLESRLSVSVTGPAGSFVVVTVSPQQAP